MFTVQVHEDVPGWIVGDAGRLRQILLNLLSNTIKFTKDESVRLSVSLSGHGRMESLTVSDSGIGIAPEKISQSFEAFTQAESSTKRRFGGTGLGLAICRRLSLAMNAELSVRSRSNES